MVFLISGILYYILQIRHKEDKLLKGNVENYLKECDVVELIHNTRDLEDAINVYLKYIEPDWSPGFYSQRESVEHTMTDAYTTHIDYRRMIKGIPKEYVLIDGEQNKDIMDSFISVLRDVKLQELLK